MKKIPIRHLIATQKEPGVSEDFSIRSVRNLLGGKGMDQELHRHNFFLVLLLQKGRGNHEIDFVSHEVADHTVFFIRPGQVHRLTLKAGSSGYLLQFNMDFYYPRSKASNQILRKASHKNVCRIEPNRAKKFHSIFTSIFQEYTDKQEGYREIIKGNLDIFFTELIRQKSKKGSDHVNPYAQERLEELLILIETNISNHKQVSQLAEKLNLSSYQLNAITKAALGKTCSELINDYIVLEAKRNLLATSNQVNQIAYHLGYEDVSYFTRFFKKHTGHSPGEFRNNFK